MKQRSILWQWAGFAVATFGGTILHFLYDWTGESILVAPFSGVNESIWEHMKLLFWPLFLFALVQRLFFRDQKKLLVRQTGGDSVGVRPDSGTVLHLQWCVRKIPRLDQHRHLLHLRIAGRFL